MTTSQDLSLLLLLSIAAAACEPAVEPEGGSGGGERDALEAAIELCGPIAEHHTACYTERYGEQASYNYLTAVGYCVAQMGYVSAAEEGCRSALEDYLACLGELPCDELLGEVEGAEPSPADGGDDEEYEPTPVPCAEQEDALEEVCDWGSVSVSSSEDG